MCVYTYIYMIYLILQVRFYFFSFRLRSGVVSCWRSSLKSRGEIWLLGFKLLGTKKLDMTGSIPRFHHLEERTCFVFVFFSCGSTTIVLTSHAYRGPRCEVHCSQNLHRLIEFLSKLQDSVSDGTWQRDWPDLRMLSAKLRLRPERHCLFCHLLSLIITVAL